jgi:hypothetical protein
MKESLEPPPVAKSSPRAPTDPDAYYNSAEESIFREPRALAIPIPLPLPPRDTDRKLNQWMEKSEKAPKNRSELSTESSNKAVASASAGTPAERYMQLGDSGSVRSQYQDAKSVGQPPRPTSGLSVRVPVVTPKTQTVVTPKMETHEPSESEDDEAPLLQSAGSFPSSTDHISPTVGIVREKVNQEDMGLFPQESRERRPNHSAKAAALQGTASHDGDTISQSPSRRGAGPVDLDEVDDTWESDDEERRSEGWDANSYPMIEMTKSEESKYTGSQSSLPTKPVPKLRSSRKDTSPIRGRKNRDAPASMRGESPGDNAPQRGTDKAPQRGTTNMDVNKSAMSQSSQEGNSFTSAGKSRENDPFTSAGKSRENDPFTSAGKSRENDPFTSAGKSPDSPSRESHAFTSPGKSAESPSVKARLQQWESRAIDAVPSTEEEKNPGATAEWKAFLGKKVHAESAAAARQQGASGGREEFKEAARQQLASGGREEFKEAARQQGTSGAREESKEDFKETKGPGGDKLNRKTHPGSASSFVSAGGGRHVVETHAEEDDSSLFEFPANAPAERSGRVSREREQEQEQSSSLERLDLSPIRSKGDDSDSDDNAVSEAYGPETHERMSFLRRLTECAAPLMPSSTRNPTNSDAMPTAHLAFLRTNPQGAGAQQKGASRFVPPGLCGRPDIIDEDEDTEESAHSNEADERKATGQNQSQLPESREKPRSKSATRGVSTSSVVSDDVGSKTAYFEAIAMKAAVSKPRRNESRRRDRSSASSVTSGSSQHSEKWRAFLDRKKASGASPPKSRASSSTEVSKAAEKYAAEKVEEMMAAMAARSKSASRTGREPDTSTSMDWPSINTSGDSLKYGDKQTKPNKPDSVRAAEDLAAARVEAMMASLSSSHLDEGEI